MARRSAARAPAAPARTFRTRAASPTACRFPHYVLDYEARFAKAVMGAFADSYLQGETPVPCIACNQKIKFHDLLETASGLGASALATGHYVRERARRRAVGSFTAPPTRSATRAISCSPPRASSLRFLRFPLGAAGQGRDAQARTGLRARGGGEVRQPGHLLRADRALYASDRALASGRRRGRQHRPCRRPRARPPWRDHQLHDRPAEGDRRCRRRSRSMC